uniref:Ras-related protein Rab-24 n=1 Tax=Magallana gigas TaxID=29159 RepID=K1R169_MAGGI
MERSIGIATIGAAFVSKKIEALGKRVTLNIWDTDGSEQYQPLTKIYYRGARAAILCYDLTERTSFDKIRYWVGELQENEQPTETKSRGAYAIPPASASASGPG